jgi:hypothetical protein
MGRNPVNSPTPARSLHIIFATTSGRTEYVVDTLTSSIGLRGWEIDKTLAEKASPPGMLRGAALLLASFCSGERPERQRGRRVREDRCVARRQKYPGSAREGGQKSGHSANAVRSDLHARRQSRMGVAENLVSVHAPQHLDAWWKHHRSARIK